MENIKQTTYIAEQLSQLRDLLIVIERGGEKSPDILYKLAIEKSQNITAFIEQWYKEVAPEVVQIPEEYDQWLSGKTQEDVAVQNEVEQNSVEAVEFFPLDVDSEKSYHDGNEASLGKAAYKHDIITPFVEDSNEQEDEDVEEMDDEAFADEDDDEEFYFDTDEEYGYVDEDDTPVVDYEPDIFVEEVGVADDDNEEYDNEESADEEDIDDLQIYNRGEPFENEDHVVTLGEKVGMQQAKELRRAISLNDRFRFRRELFGNSDVQMTELLTLLDAMKSYNEAYEYLVKDLGWNTDELVVQEFLLLVERHFK